MALTDRVVIRPARKEDEPFIKAFTTDTFDWGDYVAEAISEWVDDEAGGRGNVYVAVVDGRPVAVTHVSYMSKDEAWFEGIRVHPDFRRLGIGRLLTVSSIEGSRRRGMKVCRAAIDGDNQKSMSLASSFGFKPVASIVQFEVDVADLVPSSGDPAAPRIRTAEAGDAIAIFQAASREMAYVGSDFYWSSVSPANVGRMVDEGKFLIAIAAVDWPAAGAGGRQGAQLEALDGPEHLLAGVAVSEIYADSEGKHPVVYGELSSLFGDISGILALAEDYARGIIDKATAKHLPAELALTCEKDSLAARALRERGFKERYIEGRQDEIRLWELRLD